MGKGWSKDTQDFHEDGYATVAFPDRQTPDRSSRSLPNTNHMQGGMTDDSGAYGTTLDDSKGQLDQTGPLGPFTENHPVSFSPKKHVSNTPVTPAPLVHRARVEDPRLPSMLLPAGAVTGGMALRSPFISTPKIQTGGMKTDENTSPEDCQRGASQMVTAVLRPSTPVTPNPLVRQRPSPIASGLLKLQQVQQIRQAGQIVDDSAEIKPTYNDLDNLPPEPLLPVFQDTVEPDEQVDPFSSPQGKECNFTIGEARARACVGLVREYMSRQVGKNLKRDYGVGFVPGEEFNVQAVINFCKHHQLDPPSTAYLKSLAEKVQNMDGLYTFLAGKRRANYHFDSQALMKEIKERHLVRHNKPFLNTMKAAFEFLRQARPGLQGGWFNMVCEIVRVNQQRRRGYRVELEYHLEALGIYSQFLTMPMDTPNLRDLANPRSYEAKMKLIWWSRYFAEGPVDPRMKDRFCGLLGVRTA